MKRLLLLVVLLMCVGGVVAQTNPYYESRVELFNQMPIHSNDIVFLGNSITDRCEWSEFFSNRHIKNRGIDGDRADWMLERLDNLVAAHPKKLFLLVGINDLMQGRQAEQVAQSVDQILKRFETESPWTKIYVQSIFPVNGVDTTPQHPEWVANQVIQQTNALLEELCKERKNIFYVDVFSALVNDRGLLDSRYTNDGIHLTGRGYMVWKEVIEKFVK